MGQLTLPDIIQELSFPLEILGFSLTLIEIFSQKVSIKIEGVIDLVESILLTKSEKLMNFIMLVISRYSIFILIIAGILFGPIIFIHGLLGPSDHSMMTADEYYSLQENLGKFTGPIAKVFAIILGIIIALFLTPLFVIYIFRLIFQLLASIISGLNKLTKGRALGALGFIIGSFGLLSEGIQIYFLNSENKISTIYYVGIMCLVFFLLVVYLKFKSIE